jgi:hypothetical protein
MKSSGLAAVGVSVESANQDSLNLFRKGQKAEAIYRTLGLFERLDISCEVNLIFFDPYLSLSGVRANVELLRYVRGLKCLAYSDAFPFSELKAFPWTPVARQLRAEDAAAALRTVAAALRDWASLRVMRYVEARLRSFRSPLERDFDRDIALLHELNRRLSVLDEILLHVPGKCDRTAKP